MESINLFVDEIYDYVVTVLNKAAQLFVPQKHGNFYKFWWGRSLKLPKQHPLNLITCGRPQENSDKAPFLKRGSGVDLCTGNFSARRKNVKRYHIPTTYMKPY